MDNLLKDMQITTMKNWTKNSRNREVWHTLLEEAKSHKGRRRTTKGIHTHTLTYIHTHIHIHTHTHTHIHIHAHTFTF